MSASLSAAERRTEEAEAHRDRMLAKHGDNGHRDVTHADQLVEQAEEAEFLIAQREAWKQRTA